MVVGSHFLRLLRVQLGEHKMMRERLLRRSFRDGWAEIFSTVYEDTRFNTIFIDEGR